MEDIRKGRVLILGDGNFSFTGAFCRRMQRLREDKEVSASVVSSVREARTQLLERYPECGEHIQWLEGRGKQGIKEGGRLGPQLEVGAAGIGHSDGKV